jgi:Ca2+-binding RTX toxin-like protein
VVTVIDLDMGSEVGEFDSTDTLWEVERLEFRDRTVMVQELLPDPQLDELFDLRDVAAGRAAGGGGNDTYLVDGPDDQLREAPDAGHDRVEASASWTLTSGFEDLRLLGTEPLEGAGNAQPNRLHGNAGANRLDGGAGNDTLAGGAGADTLLGGAGDDTYLVTRGDRITEAADAGNDVVLSAISWTLRANLEALVLTGSRAASGTGSADANTLTGNVAANRLAGRGGDDILAGRAGDDWLDGGAGNDTLGGGPGADVFVFAQAPDGHDNVDLLSDFTPGTDTIRLDADAFAGLAGGTLDPARFLTGSGVANTPEQRILYDRDSGSLYYDADGSGAAPALLFAVLGSERHPALHAADFLIGA